MGQLYFWTDCDVTFFFVNRAAIITVGLGSFILARDSVNKNRYAVMKTRERIRDKTRSEQEEKSEKSWNIEDVKNFHIAFLYTV